MKRCINCKTVLEDDELFCHECGAKQEIEESAVPNEEATPMEKKCIHCGETIEEDSAFCPYCGKPQTVEDVEESLSDEQTEEPKQEKDSLLEEKVEPEKEEPISDEKPEPKEAVAQEIPEEQISYEIEEENKSKKWLWILILFLLIGGGAWFYLNNSDSSSDDQPNVNIDSVSVINEIQKEEINDVVEDKIINAEVFLKKMYEEFYEPYNIDRSGKELLSKYFSESTMSKFYVESDYSAGEFFYCIDFLIDGHIGGGDSPDYGDKVVTRTIENKGNGWYEVTNIWDVIKTPVKVRLKVDNTDSKFFISDFIIIDENNE